jgi:hypothetical protein
MLEINEDARRDTQVYADEREELDLAFLSLGESLFFDAVEITDLYTLAAWSASVTSPDLDLDLSIEACLSGKRDESVVHYVPELLERAYGKEMRELLGSAGFASVVKSAEASVSQDVGGPRLDPYPFLRRVLRETVVSCLVYESCLLALDRDLDAETPATFLNLAWEGKPCLGVTKARLPFVLSVN